ncbi:isochorismatase family protein [Nocardia xishanensis]|uniref:isochorismatase family protein n=1 Tax=Nocardia xishanensis TaxID=238964 RepID=UPI0033F9130A
MPVASFDNTALVLIDLQRGIVERPTVRPVRDVLRQSVRLAKAFRANRLPVVVVRVEWSEDSGDLPPVACDRPGPAAAPRPPFGEIPAELVDLADVFITKRHWGAFTGTELDLQLRRRRIDRLVLAGIATSIGVESTARSAWEHSYELVFAEDATTDTDEASHLHSFTKIFPRLGRVCSTEQILAALGA